MLLWNLIQNHWFYHLSVVILYSLFYALSFFIAFITIRYIIFVYCLHSSPFTEYKPHGDQDIFCVFSSVDGIVQPFWPAILVWPMSLDHTDEQWFDYRNVSFKSKSSKMLCSLEKNLTLLIKRPVLQKTVLNCYILNFINTKLGNFIFSFVM